MGALGAAADTRDTRHAKKRPRPARTVPSLASKRPVTKRSPPKQRSLLDVLKPMSASSFAGSARLTRKAGPEIAVQDEELHQHAPVNLLRDVLPPKLAQRCLTLLDQVARSWRTHPWYIFNRWTQTPRSSKCFRLNNKNFESYGAESALLVEGDTSSVDGEASPAEAETSGELAALLQEVSTLIADLVDRIRPGRSPKFVPTLALGNRYADGNQSVGSHSDFLGELGPRPIIVGLSLGALALSH